MQEQRFHPGASIEMSLSPTPSTELHNNGPTLKDVEDEAVNPPNTTVTAAVTTKKSPNKRRPRSTEVKDPPALVITQNRYVGNVEEILR